MEVPSIIPVVIQTKYNIQNRREIKPANLEKGNIFQESKEIDKGKLLEAQRAYAGIDGVSFGYHHPIKTLYKKGKLDWIKVGFYGDKLTKKNVTLEHLETVFDFKKKCKNEQKAKRLATTWENVVLASSNMNNARGCEPLSQFIDYEAMGRYLAQFEGKYIPGYGTGEKYIKAILNTVNKLIQQDR